MAKSPRYKVYTPDGKYEAAVKHAEVAAAVVSLLGNGATVRDGHKAVIWTEGVDGDAGQSYDNAAARIISKSHPPHRAADLCFVPD